ncbi:SDR family oxidoreductase [Candidatus Poriferisodalis sp.]|uniref:SDR family oxidoreductase n=1 Tax=Candidatus Poriferisodalis sp. TaxID=3101277 RepID=UPI003AF90088
MDLGLDGRSAILMASSRGLGRACAHSVAREGVDVVINGRTAADVEATANDIASAYGVNAQAVVGDATESNIQMSRRGISYEEARAEQEATINAGRLGRPEEFGDAFAFMCSAQAGYISGQSLQLDGGSYGGVF